MSQRELFSVLLRTLAVYFVWQGVYPLSMSAGMGPGAMMPGGMMSGLLQSVAIQAAGGAILFLLANPIAALCYPAK